MLGNGNQKEQKRYLTLKMRKDILSNQDRVKGWPKAGLSEQLIEQFSDYPGKLLYKANQKLNCLIFVHMTLMHNPVSEKQINPNAFLHL